MSGNLSPGSLALKLTLLTITQCRHSNTYLHVSQCFTAIVITANYMIELISYG